jgi:NADH-quinone oxidoreductase subunit H
MDATVLDYLSQTTLFLTASKHLSPLMGAATSPFLLTVLLLVVAGAITIVMATVGGFGTYAERKISADIQGRLGPNRVGPYGLLQVLADGIKMVSKEDIAPKTSDKFLFYLAPFLCVFGVISTFAVMPISSGLTLTNLNIGIFYLVAISSLVGVGIFLGGYASNSKWSMLGGMRGASQIISYEIPVTLSILSVVVMTGSLSFQGVLAHQGGLPHQWLIFHNPFMFIGFFILFIASLAETNRAPFDLPEAESELVSGYHTEYTGIRFGLFALAEYMEVFVVSAVASALFLGGYLVPFNLGGDGFVGQVLQISIFMAKALALYYVVIWIRWTFPRLRVDQLMSVCWKYLTPIAIFNLVGNAIWLVVFDGKSILQLLSSLGGSGGHH